MSTSVKSSSAPLILVVDDEPRLVRLVKANLEHENFRVVSAPNGAFALEAVERENPDLVVLDIMMPVMDGFEVARRIREFSQVPIVMLTAKGEQSDILKGFDIGIDDYITKPFDPSELIARVRAVLRRTQQQQELRPHPTFTTGDLTVDFVRHRATVGDREVKLSPTEYRLLSFMAANAGRVLLHEELLQHVWGPEYRDETEYLWVYIRYLRQKIERDPAHPELIVSEPGIGYLLRQSPPSDSS